MLKINQSARQVTHGMNIEIYGVANISLCHMRLNSSAKILFHAAKRNLAIFVKAKLI